jgi:hypothetical protein
MSPIQLPSPKLRATTTRNACVPKNDSSTPDPRNQFSKARPLALRIGVSAKTIFRWAEAGLISRRKVNARVVLFDIAEVISFVERCRVA